MGDEERHVLIINKNKDKDCLLFDQPRDDELRSFKSCLTWMCIDQSNIYRACLSWLLFFLLAILVPLLSHYVLAIVEYDGKLRRPYDGVVQLSLTSVATASFIFLSRFIRKYGLRSFLSLDKLCSESQKVRQGYTLELNRSIKLLAVFVLPCFAAEAAYKILWYSSGYTRIPFVGNVYASDGLACVLELCSWLYRTSIFFLVCVLFRLICYLQILRLQDFAQVFQANSDTESILAEHLKIKLHLRVISHRYRVFILYSLIIITASQLASLLNATRPHADVSIFGAGELALCSLTLMAGVFVVLRSATKITHKAQSMTCLASKWHICATIDSFDAPCNEPPTSHTTSYSRLFPVMKPNLESEEEEAPTSHTTSYSRLFPVMKPNLDSEEEEDTSDEELDADAITITMPTYAHTICFQKRQALVTYFENNRAGITVFGFMLDRTSLHTMFMIELALVLWLLGKTIGFT